MEVQWSPGQQSASAAAVKRKYSTSIRRRRRTASHATCVKAALKSAAQASVFLAIPSPRNRCPIGLLVVREEPDVTHEQIASARRAVVQLGQALVQLLRPDPE